MQRPESLRPGDLVAIVAPGAAVDEDRLAQGVSRLEAAGLRVRVGESVRRRHGYLAGTDEERLSDLHAAFADPEVSAVITARGGYGCGRLLPRLDRELLRANPKIFVGHSDVTFLLTELTQELGLVTFHGPMVLNLPVQPEGADRLMALLMGDDRGVLGTATEVLRDGVAEAPIVGGCLSIVTAALGTPHALDPRGTIFFLEDINEKPFRIDRMLTQLRQSGAFEGVAAVVFGEMPGCTAGEGERTTVVDVVREAFDGSAFPVAFGVPSGHGLGSVTLPLGVLARLEGGTLTLVDGAFGGQRA